MIKYLHYKHRFLIGFSFFLGSLTACQIKESNISIHTTTYIPKYLSLLDEVERFRCYLSDNKERADYIEKIKVKIQQSNNRDIYLKQLEKAKKTQSSLTEVMYDYTAELLTGKVHMNNYLHFLLEQRMYFLEQRTCDIKTYWQEIFTLEGANKPFYPPTDYGLFTWLMTDPTFKPHKDINQRCKQDMINRYTMLNQIIVKAFQLASFTELEQTTILLLRASVSLHPLLKNPNCNNPRVHIPDYASGYAIILPLLKKYIKKHKGYYSHQIIISLAFLDADQKQRTMEETCSLKKDVELQQYFKDVQGVDVLHYIGHWGYYPFAFAPAAKSSSTISATAYDLGIWPYKLPNPDFLNPKLEEVPDTEDALPPSFFINHPFKKDEQVNNNDNSPLQHNKQAHVDELNDSEIDDDDDQPSINNTTEQPTISSSKVFEPKSKDKKQLHHDKRTQLQGKILDDIANQVAKKSGTVLARGLRIFHQKLFESTYPIRKLKKKQQNMVDAFFDPQKIADLSYRKFKTLWCGVGGKILENTGSSHNILQDEKGNKIGNIFAHGKNQTYGKQYIKYIQSYLIYFGLVPSNLSSY